MSLVEVNQPSVFDSGLWVYLCDTVHMPDSASPFANRKRVSVQWLPLFAGSVGGIAVRSTSSVRRRSSPAPPRPKVSLSPPFAAHHSPFTIHPFGDGLRPRRASTEGLHVSIDRLQFTIHFSLFTSNPFGSGLCSRPVKGPTVLPPEKLRPIRVLKQFPPPKAPNFRETRIPYVGVNLSPMLAFDHG